MDYWNRDLEAAILFMRKVGCLIDLIQVNLALARVYFINQRLVMILISTLL